MADPDTIAIPDNVLDALRLAERATAKAAGTQLWQDGVLPGDWADIYGSVQEILHNLGDLAAVAVNRGQDSLIEGELYVDEFGEPDKTVGAYLGDWRAYTHIACGRLMGASTVWASAHSAISRIGVRAEDGE